MTRSGAVVACLLALGATTLHAACPDTLSSFARTGDPALRDRLADGSYEVASDPHVTVLPDGTLQMIYAGDDRDRVSIKRVVSDGAGWSSPQVLLGASTGHTEPVSKETPFYRRAADGTHHIYFIGYADEATYQASIYRATAPAAGGPYRIDPDPVMARGPIAGRDVYLTTSPSVVDHAGRLWMVFLGWNGFDDVTAVWSFGAVSDDEGATWHTPREVPVPVGMEGQITPRPDGGFVATRTSEWRGTEAIFLACSDHPFGPYEDIGPPAVTPAGPPWEVDELIAAQVFYPPDGGAPELYYTGADHRKGWWILKAVAQ